MTSDPGLLLLFLILLNDGSELWLVNKCWILLFISLLLQISILYILPVARVSISASFHASDPVSTVCKQLFATERVLLGSGFFHGILRNNVTVGRISRG